MNLGDVQVVVRARDTRESVDLAFPFIFRVGGRGYAILVTSVTLASLLLCVGVKVAFDLGWVQLWWLALPLGVWSQGIFTIAAGNLMFESEVRSGRVLSAFLKRVVPYTLSMLVTRGALLLASVTVLLAPWVWSQLLFVPEATLLEHATVTGAAGRARRLAGHFSFAQFELLFWLTLTTAFAVLAAESVGQGMLGYTLQLELPLGSLLQDGGSLYALSGWFLAIPLAATVRFLSYIDGRTRRDAWDVQVRLQRIVQLEDGAR